MPRKDHWLPRAGDGSGWGKLQKGMQKLLGTVDCLGTDLWG